MLESINGINLTNADHRDAVRAVKETKRTLSIVSELPFYVMMTFTFQNHIHLLFHYLYI